MQEGSTSKFWFRSHHLVEDMGGTWFQMSDGTTSYMAGQFCCEVQLPEPPLAEGTAEPIRQRLAETASPLHASDAPSASNLSGRAVLGEEEHDEIDRAFALGEFRFGEILKKRDVSG